MVIFSPFSLQVNVPFGPAVSRRGFPERGSVHVHVSPTHCIFWKFPSLSHSLVNSQSGSVKNVPGKLVFINDHRIQEILVVIINLTCDNAR